VREGRHVRLLPLMPEHLPAVHRMVVGTPAGTFWRSGGRWIAAGALERYLADGVHLSAVATDRGSGAVRGLLELLHVVEGAGHGELSMLWPEADGFSLEALALFCDEVFSRFGLDRLFAFVCESVAHRLGVARLEGLRTCGRLPAYRRTGSRREDVVVYELSRDGFVSAIAAIGMTGSRTPWKVLRDDGRGTQQAV
jgi:hypothetical protein